MNQPANFTRQFDLGLIAETEISQVIIVTLAFQGLADLVGTDI